MQMTSEERSVHELALKLIEEAKASLESGHYHETLKTLARVERSVTTRRNQEQRKARIWKAQGDFARLYGSRVKCIKGDEFGQYGVVEALETKNGRPEFVIRMEDGTKITTGYFREFFKLA